ncbi:tRNA-specific 2-thiouridylase MnmA [Linum grandiflorum]
MMIKLSAFRPMFSVSTKLLPSLPFPSKPCSLQLTPPLIFFNPSSPAFYLKIWFQEDYENFWSECPWDEDLKYATAVCNQVDVPLEVVHLTDEYWNNVVSYIIKEYQCGRTPNRDVLCNTRIKFGRCFPRCCKWDGIRFDYIASGHYASVVHPSSGHVDQPSILELVGVQSLVIEEYDPARPNDYEDYRREKKRKALEAERLREPERRRQEKEEREKVEKEERERDRERDKNISWEEAWRRRAAMS